MDNIKLVEKIKKDKKLLKMYEIFNMHIEKCAEIDTLVEKKQQFLAEMANYKKSLIYEYVTGKKEVA